MCKGKFWGLNVPKKYIRDGGRVSIELATDLHLQLVDSRRTDI